MYKKLNDSKGVENEARVDLIKNASTKLRKNH